MSTTGPLNTVAIGIWRSHRVPFGIKQPLDPTALRRAHAAVLFGLWVRARVSGHLLRKSTWSGSQYCRTRGSERATESPRSWSTENRWAKIGSQTMNTRTGPHFGLLELRPIRLRMTPRRHVAHVGDKRTMIRVSLVARFEVSLQCGKGRGVQIPERAVARRVNRGFAKARPCERTDDRTGAREARTAFVGSWHPISEQPGDHLGKRNTTSSTTAPDRARNHHRGGGGPLADLSAPARAERLQGRGAMPSLPGTMTGRCP